jgi:hypothetical protein
MSVFSRKVNDKSDEYEENRAAIAALMDEWPEICACLLGTPPLFEGSPVAPGTIRLFMNGGRLKAMLSPKNSELALYTTIAEPEHILACLEQNLQEGKYDWKRSTERTTPY